MTNFEKWDNEFKTQNLYAFNQDANGLLWLKVRAVCRSKQIKQFVSQNHITLAKIKIAEQNVELFEKLERLPHAMQLLDRYLKNRSHDWYNAMGVDEEKLKEDFSNELCKLTGMTNGYPYIRVKEDGDAKHTGGTKKPRYDIDKEFFKGKFVLLFDDVITRGESMGLFGIALKGFGAEVIGGFSIGITKHELQSSFDPIVELFSNPNHEENN